MNLVPSPPCCLCCCTRRVLTIAKCKNELTSNDGIDVSFQRLWFCPSSLPSFRYSSKNRMVPIEIWFPLYSQVLYISGFSLYKATLNPDRRRVDLSLDPDGQQIMDSRDGGRYAYNCRLDDSIVIPNTIPEPERYSGFVIKLQFCNKVEAPNGNVIGVLESFDNVFDIPQQEFLDDYVTMEFLLYIFLRRVKIRERFRTLQRPDEGEQDAIARASRERVESSVGDDVFAPGKGRKAFMEAHAMRKSAKAQATAVRESTTTNNVNTVPVQEPGFIIRFFSDSYLYFLAGVDQVVHSFLFPSLRLGIRCRGFTALYLHQVSLTWRVGCDSKLEFNFVFPSFFPPLNPSIPTKLAATSVVWVFWFVGCQCRSPVFHGELSGIYEGRKSSMPAVEFTVLFRIISTQSLQLSISEILKNDGLVSEKKVLTSAVGTKDETKGRLIQKACHLTWFQPGVRRLYSPSEEVAKRALLDGQEEYQIRGF
ncbi:hypothetical protein Vadar_030255 [Vaccinium darrowii]|uniref:Uncharacterized protein n=1 Tax=Vaccinium darrowii TaxID=229202 RepID=A0ACB7YA31_9ERIC|nr:hypothetical protein Vadar_030255 [Vaccinium darrowii]